MKQYSVDEIRSLFLEFFRSKDHRILPSASLIPHGDPTLLLTVAGMVPFKLNFLGLKTCSSENCNQPKVYRTADIENVGETDRHGTFFESVAIFLLGTISKQKLFPGLGNSPWSISSFLRKTLGLNLSG